MSPTIRPEWRKDPLAANIERATLNGTRYQLRSYRNGLGERKHSVSYWIEAERYWHFIGEFDDAFAARNHAETVAALAHSR